MNVLIVDDDPKNRYLLELILRGSGFEVEAAQHGADALEVARQRPPELVVSDLLMPVMDGYSLLRQWRADEVLGQVPFVIYTATYTDAEDERLARDLGADAFILKPAEPAALVERIREVMASSRERPTASGSGLIEEVQLLENYSRTLVRKLEEKMLQLEATNRNLELAHQVAGIGSWELDISTLTSSWSAAARRIFEVPLDGPEPTYEETLALVHPEDCAATDLAFRQSLTSATVNQLEHRLLVPSGGLKHIIQRWQVFVGADGVPTRAVGICQDVTERTEIELERHRVGALLAAVFENTSDAVFVKDREGQYLLINRAGSEFIGRPVEDIVGRDDRDLFGAHEVDALMARDRQVMDSAETSMVEESLTSAGVTRTYLATKSPYRDGNDQVVGVVGISRDVTDIRRLEAQFLRKQRLESIGTLAGGIAHDLNNVLAPILMSIELLKLDESDATRVDILDTIQSSARRGADMVNQVLSFARGVESERTAMNIAVLVDEVAKIAAETFPKDVIVRVRTEDDLRAVLGDPTQLHQVLLNLCVNARDAMADTGGELTLTAVSVDLSDQEVAHGLALGAGPHVLIEVVDSGAGMPAHVLDRAFEPFFTTKSPGRGTGLGLSTSQAIVAGHGGTMRLVSEVGVGSTVSVYLPATESAAVAPALPLHLLRGRGEVVLLVDDEAAVLQIAKQTLEAFGYRVVAANDGADAIRAFSEADEEFDVIVTDMMMPVEDGPSLIRHLTSAEHHPPIIGVSGLGDADMAATARGLGVAEFISKPFTAAVLLDVLDRVLRRTPSR